MVLGTIICGVLVTVGVLKVIDGVRYASAGCKVGKPSQAYKIACRHR